MLWAEGTTSAKAPGIDLFKEQKGILGSSVSEASLAQVLISWLMRSGPYMGFRAQRESAQIFSFLCPFPHLHALSVSRINK